MGAAVALYSAQCFAMGRFANGLPYPPITLDFVIGFSGWLPFSGMESSGTTARRRAAHLKILLLHGDDDPQVPYETSIWYAEFLRTSGFSVDFRTFNRLQHFWTYREMDYVKQWLRPRIAVPRRHGRL
ncbi:carboxylesterase SOBER1 isoform X2 [Triticum aestivum]|nr:carboxylesterase SOBER1-like isoform X2 [Triticum aestivum]XP_044348239.1 carboxylesterase SOBER1-like isoform X2 [Triticum aestivum]